MLQLEGRISSQILEVNGLRIEKYMDKPSTYSFLLNVIMSEIITLQIYFILLRSLNNIGNNKKYIIGLFK